MRTHANSTLGRLQMAHARLNFYGQTVSQAVWDRMLRSDQATQHEPDDAREGKLIEAENRLDRAYSHKSQRIAPVPREQHAHRRQSISDETLVTLNRAQLRRPQFERRDQSNIQRYKSSTGRTGLGRQQSTYAIYQCVRDVVESFESAITAGAWIRIRQAAQDAGRSPRLSGRTFYTRDDSQLSFSGDREFDESEHPRVPAGHPDGGQFTKVGTNRGAETNTGVAKTSPTLNRQSDLSPMRQSKLFPGYSIAPDGKLIDPDTQSPVQLAAGTAGPFLPILFGLPAATPRSDFLSTLSDAARELLTSDWEVHHIYQQADVPELQDLFKTYKPKCDIQGIDNLAAVPKVVHTEISNLQGQFWEQEFEKLAKKGIVKPGEYTEKSKIQAVVKYTSNKKELFEKYEKMVTHIDDTYGQFMAKKNATATMIASAKTNIKDFNSPLKKAKRMIAHAEVMDPTLAKTLKKRGAKGLAADMIKAENEGMKSGRFSKILRYIGIGSFLMMVNSVARGATSKEAEQALGDLLDAYSVALEREADIGHVKENDLQKVADCFNKYMQAANIPDDTCVKIMTLLRMKIGLQFDAGD